MAVVTTGFFDGVHIGHRLVIRTLVQAARERGGKAVVATFWPHPRTVLQDGARDLRLLSTLEEKRSMLLSLGVDEVEVIPFTREFSRLSARDYLQEYVAGRFGGTAILLGYDNRIGRRTDSSEDASAAAEALGMEVIRTESVDSETEGAVSSTKIRLALSAGDTIGAAAMLGYNYGLHGVVVAGNRLGRTMGFPTANMQLYEPLKLIPGNGVYLVEVETLGQKYYGMCNIGIRPTVGSSNARTVETNIFDFDEDIYGLDMRIRFREKIRDEKRFESLAQLREQLILDRENCFSLI